MTALALIGPTNARLDAFVADPRDPIIARMASRPLSGTTGARSRRSVSLPCAVPPGYHGWRKGGSGRSTAHPRSDTVTEE